MSLQLEDRPETTQDEKAMVPEEETKTPKHFLSSDSEGRVLVFASGGAAIGTAISGFWGGLIGAVLLPVSAALLFTQPFMKTPLKQLLHK